MTRAYVLDGRLYVDTSMPARADVATVDVQIRQHSRDGRTTLNAENAVPIDQPQAGLIAEDPE